MKKLITSLIVLFVFFSNLISNVVLARENIVETSALITPAQANPEIIEKEQKVNTLTSFLKERNSPLTAFARIFVEEAEKNELDYRLVPAITGVESSFGKAIPTDSFNAYGWANGNYFFASWEESIAIVTKTLNEQYKQGWGAETPEQIGKYYAASPTWASRVVLFMEQIGKATPQVSDLSLNL